MNLRKIVTFVVLLTFIAILWYGVSKGEFAETIFNGNLL
jgi:hypothetical protein